MLRNTLTVALIALSAAPALAGLEEEAGITEGLITVGIAYEISEVCPRLDGRTLRGFRYLLGLKSAARSMGYSAAEVDAFIHDDAAKSRLEAIARGRLAAKGAKAGDAEAHCRVGTAEMRADSQIGRLLEVD